MLAMLSPILAYGLLGLVLRVWHHRLSPSRLSTPIEIEAYHRQGFPNNLYEFHPTRQITMRADARAERHRSAQDWMHTDSRGLAHLPSQEGRNSVLVLGDSVAFGSWLPYEYSFPGLLSIGTDAKVFSGATGSYNLRQTYDLYREVGGEWDLILFVWVINDFYEWRFRKTSNRPEPLAGLKRPIDLFDVKDVFYRVTDRFARPPRGLAYDELLAWSPKRYEEHFAMLEAMNKHKNLVVVLTYAKPQFATQRFDPQEWMKQGLEEREIRFIDTRPAYRDDMFIFKTDNIHFNATASVAWTEYVILELLKITDVVGLRRKARQPAVQPAASEGTPSSAERRNNQTL
ncbi:MAG: hypothetical protein AAF492_02460 [Verrucomicrobiota bacterium]